MTIVPTPRAPIPQARSLHAVPPYVVLEAPTNRVVAEVDDERVGFVIGRRSCLDLEIREVVMGEPLENLSDVFGMVDFASEPPEDDDLASVRISAPQL